MSVFLTGFLDWFIPPSIKEDINRYGKAKMTVGIGLLVGFVIGLQSIRSLFIHVNYTVAAAVIVFSLLIMSGPFLLKVTRSLTLAANITLSGLFILASLIVLMRGGITSSIASYLSLVSLCALMTSGLRSGIIWGLLSIGSLIAIFQIKQMGVNLPSQELTGKALELYLLITYAVLVVFATILGSIFEVISNSNFIRFRNAQEESDRTNARLLEALKDVAGVMEAVSRNDLSQRVTYRIEGNLEQLKSSVNTAIDLLSQTISNVTDSSQQINRRTADLSNSSQVLAKGTSTQASSIEEISASMSQIEGVTRQTNEHAKLSRQLTEQTLQVATAGNQKMTEMVTNMNRIAEAGKNVTKVVKVIDEIAFQTNLLALNAAVEAARAGKYGKGFSVVAEEVRNLAGRSSEAVKDTGALIETTMKEMENGVASAHTTAELLNEIMQRVEKVNGLIVEIASGSEDQKTGIEEITSALDQVNRVVQQNSGISNETANASAELNEHSNHLQETMGRFIIRNQHPAVSSKTGSAKPSPRRLLIEPSYNSN